MRVTRRQLQCDPVPSRGQIVWCPRALRAHPPAGTKPDAVVASRCRARVWCRSPTQVRFRRGACRQDSPDVGFHEMFSLFPFKILTVTRPISVLDSL